VTVTLIHRVRTGWGLNYHHLPALLIGFTPDLMIVENECDRVGLSLSLFVSFLFFFFFSYDSLDQPVWQECGVCHFVKLAQELDGWDWTSPKVRDGAI
jgi:hypothetical protein